MCLTFIIYYQYYFPFKFKLSVQVLSCVAYLDVQYMKVVEEIPSIPLRIFENKKSMHYQTIL